MVLESGDPFQTRFVNLPGEKNRHITREVSKHQTSDGLVMAAIEAVCNAKDPGEPLDKLTAVGIELCDIGQQGRTRIDPPHRGLEFRAPGSGRGSACGCRAPAQFRSALSLMPHILLRGTSLQNRIFARRI